MVIDSSAEIITFFFCGWEFERFLFIGKKERLLKLNDSVHHFVTNGSFKNLRVSLKREFLVSHPVGIHHSLFQKLRARLIIIV